MWTHFWDSNSGGKQKLAWAHIYIELERSEACEEFKKRFNRDPNNVSCGGCGPDYMINSKAELSQVTAYQRKCSFDLEKKLWVEQIRADEFPTNELISLEEYCQSAEILIVDRKALQTRG